MSKNPYTWERLVAYELTAILLGAGASECGKKQPDCTRNPSGEVQCPLQTGRQEP